MIDINNKIEFFGNPHGFECYPHDNHDFFQLFYDFNLSLPWQFIIRQRKNKIYYIYIRYDLLDCQNRKGLFGISVVFDSIYFDSPNFILSLFRTFFDFVLKENQILSMNNNNAIQFKICNFETNKTIFDNLIENFSQIITIACKKKFIEISSNFNIPTNKVALLPQNASDYLINKHFDKYQNVNVQPIENIHYSSVENTHDSSIENTHSSSIDNDIKIIGDSNITLQNISNSQVNLHQIVSYEVNKIIENRATEIGLVSYDIPSDMIKNQISKCNVRIAKNKLNLNVLNLSKNSIFEQIRISEVMKVQLIDPSNGQNFNITCLNNYEQIISANEFTEWIFNVKPLRSGFFELFLRVTILEILKDFGERSKDVIVLNRSIKVKSNSILTTLKNLINK